MRAARSGHQAGKAMRTFGSRRRPSVRPPGLRAWSLRTCQGLRPRGTLALTHPRIAFRRDKSVGVPIDNSAARWLAYASPADASSPASRPKTHGSGPEWFATPSPQWTCTTYSSPASQRTVIVMP